MNDPPNTFVRVDDNVLIRAIEQAHQRLVFIAPGLRPPVAEALAKAMSVVPAASIHLVSDVDSEVCRLGYGDKDFKGMELLQAAAAKHDLTVNHHPGIRIGLVIADDTTLIYSPTPELIEAESRQPDKPNAIVLRAELPKQLAAACGVGEEGHTRLEVGKDGLDAKKVEEVKRDLADRPPKEFNIARIERAFSSLLQYVEFKIENYKLTTRSVHLKPELFGVQNEDVIRRLTNRYRLFAESDSLTVEIPAFKEDGIPDPQKPKEKFGPLSVDRERNPIKKKYVIEAGKFGSLILRRNVHDFEKEIRVLKAKLEAYKQAVQAELKKRTDQIVTELLDALMERLQRDTPIHWHSRYLGSTPTSEDVKRLFEEDVCGAVERVKTDFNPQIFITYKDVTYETFKDPEFCKVVEDRFGKDAVDRILSEKDVAPEVKRDQERRR